MDGMTLSVGTDHLLVNNDVADPLFCGNLKGAPAEAWGLRIYKLDPEVQRQEETKSGQEKRKQKAGSRDLRAQAGEGRAGQNWLWEPLGGGKDRRNSALPE